MGDGPWRVCVSEPWAFSLLVVGPWPTMQECAFLNFFPQVCISVYIRAPTPTSGISLPRPSAGAARSPAAAHPAAMELVTPLPDGYWGGHRVTASPVGDQVTSNDVSRV